MTQVLKNNMTRVERGVRWSYIIQQTLLLLVLPFFLILTGTTLLLEDFGMISGCGGFVVRAGDCLADLRPASAGAVR